MHKAGMQNSLGTTFLSRPDQHKGSIVRFPMQPQYLITTVNQGQGYIKTKEQVLKKNQSAVNRDLFH